MVFNWDTKKSDITIFKIKKFMATSDINGNAVILKIFSTIIFILKFLGKILILNTSILCILECIYYIIIAYYDFKETL